jgi:hypothetical protein
MPKWMQGTELMTYRHFSLLTRTCLFAIAAGAVVFMGAACKEAKTPREQIIGIWEFTGMHTTGRVVFRGDGTVINLFPENDNAGSPFIPGSIGKWWLDGNAIVEESSLLWVEDGALRPTRAVIADFGRDRLVSGDGHSDSIRVAFAEARSSEVASILRGLVGLVIFVASMYAMAKSALRPAFAIIGIGAACLIVASALSVPQEFAQTGDVIISASTLRALQVPRDCFESVALLLIAGGLVWLAKKKKGGEYDMRNRH